MGHRASYVLIEGGRPEIYFSRWGALVIPAVLLSGPEGTIAYLRTLTPDTHLLDSDWAEGGVALHVDKRDVRFYGGLEVGQKPYVRRPLLRALRRLWQGWNVEWARFGIADLALSLGWDAGQVLTSNDDPLMFRDMLPIPLDDTIQLAHELKQAHSVFSVRWAANDVRDYLLTSGVWRALAAGPNLLHLLADGVAISPPREDDPTMPQGGAYLDAVGKTMSMWSPELDPRTFDLMAWLWSGWQVDGHEDGIVHQVVLSGRDPSMVMVPEEQAIEELVAELTRIDTTDPIQLYEALAKDGEARITVGKGFFSADRPQLSVEERRDMLFRLLRDTSTDTSAPRQAE